MNHDALSAVAEGGGCCVVRPLPGARQAEPSLAGSGCCWRREVASGVDIGADYSAPDLTSGCRVRSNGGRMTPTRRGRSGRTSILRAVFLLAIPALAVACATPAGGPGGSGLLLTGASQQPVDRLHQQAHDALARWADAVRRSGGASITFVGDLTGQIGEWEANNGQNKAALYAGMVEAPHGLSKDQPSGDKVKWLDGSTVDVSVLSAADTLAALVASAQSKCDDCQSLEVTDAQQATGLVDTSRGPANAPIWVYSIAGTSVKVTRVAVDKSVTVDPPPWNANDPPQGVRIDKATGAPGSKKLTVSFVGAPDGAEKKCGADYTAEAVESDLAVVVIVVEHPYSGPYASNEGCDLVGALRSAKVTLEAPLGNRVVLEVQQGLPVVVTAP